MYWRQFDGLAWASEIAVWFLPKFSTFSSGWPPPGCNTVPERTGRNHVGADAFFNELLCAAP